MNIYINLGVITIVEFIVWAKNFLRFWLKIIFIVCKYFQKTIKGVSNSNMQSTESTKDQFILDQLMYNFKIVWEITLPNILNFLYFFSFPLFWILLIWPQTIASRIAARLIPCSLLIPVLTQVLPFPATLQRYSHWLSSDTDYQPYQFFRLATPRRLEDTLFNTTYIHKFWIVVLFTEHTT